MRTRLMAATLAAVSLSACRTTDATSGGDVKSANGQSVEQYCDGIAQQYASQFLLPNRRKAAYDQSYAQCLTQNGGTPSTGDGSSELVLVRNRTQRSANSAAAHLQALPPEVKAAAACIAVVAKDDVGWGLAGASIGAGLVSCRTSQGWSSPSYLSLGGVTLGPSIGFMNDDTTFLYTKTDADNCFRNQFTFDAAVYAVAGSADASISIGTDGCFERKIFNDVQRNCTLSCSNVTGLAAGANVKGVVLRHMTGLLGGGLTGRNARVYGSGVTPNQILSTPGANGPDVTRTWVNMLNQYAP